MLLTYGTLVTVLAMPAEAKFFKCKNEAKVIEFLEYGESYDLRYRYRLRFDNCELASWVVTTIFYGEEEIRGKTK